MDAEFNIKDKRPTVDIREAYRDWLQEFAWSHWLTLTFRPYEPRTVPGLAPPRFRPSQAGPPVDYAHREWDRFVRRLGRGLGRRIWWFRGDEFGPRIGRLHFHALIGGAQGYPSRVVADQWTAGFSVVKEYDPDQGAAHYLTKYVSKELASWDVSRRPIRETGAL